MRGTERDPYPERGPLSDLARDLDRAAVQLHELLHERQADAGALVRAPVRRFDAVKALEQARQLLLGDADTRVSDLEHCVAIVSPQSHGHRPGERELERVREKVQHDLLPHLAIDVDRLAELAAVDDKRKPAFSIAERKVLARSRVSAARSVASYEAWTRPASMREKSSSELTSLCSRAALR